MLNDIYIFANFGNLSETPKSGGQSSARRVMAGLESLGYNMHPIVKHRSEWKGKWAHRVEVMLFAVVDVLKIFGKLVFKKRNKAAFLMLTYAGSLVPLEYVVTAIVRMLGFKSTYYLKGGKLMDTYDKGSERHKRMFKKIMDRQSMAFFEGMDSLRIVQAISQTPLVYFPNYVADCLPALPQERPDKPIGLLYFGRVTPEKQVHVSIEAFHLLAEKYPDMRLTIIGDSTRAVDYTARIAQMITDSPYRDRIRKLGNSPFEVLLEAMQTHHFFIFPSKEMAEGHSNSLTEAMSQGLVPIVSDWHFNRTIVGDDMLVVGGTSFDAKDYAERIDQIIRSGRMKQLSQQMCDRVKSQYTETAVLNKIGESIKSVFA